MSSLFVELFLGDGIAFAVNIIGFASTLVCDRRVYKVGNAATTKIVDDIVHSWSEGR